MRSVLIWVGTALVSASLLLSFLGRNQASFMAATIWVGILLVALVFERIVYKKELKTPPGADWARTPEVMVGDDPGAVVEVWQEAGTGERAYVRREEEGEVSGSFLKKEPKTFASRARCSWQP